MGAWASGRAGGPRGAAAAAASPSFPRDEGLRRGQTPPGGLGQVTVGVLFTIHSLQIFLLDQNVNAFLGAIFRRGRGSEREKHVQGRNGDGPPSIPGAPPPPRPEPRPRGSRPSSRTRPAVPAAQFLFEMTATRNEPRVCPGAAGHPGDPEQRATSMETASPAGSAGSADAGGRDSQDPLGRVQGGKVPRGGGDTRAWLPGREGARGSLSSGAAARFAKVSKLNAEDLALLCVRASIKR